MRCESIILAAGQGQRMKSDVPKVLHSIGGRPILTWAVETCSKATGRPPFVVVGPEADEVKQLLGTEVQYVEQAERLGTGHAVLQARDRLRGAATHVLVVNAGLPLLRPETLSTLLERQMANPGPLTLLVASTRVARGFARVLRDRDGSVMAIVEEAHASPGELAIEELNVGACAFDAAWLWEHVDRVPLSPKGEYYLTDLVAVAAGEGKAAATLEVLDLDEVIGINTREHLAEAESALRRRINRRWMLDGVTIIDPQATYIGPEVSLGRDTTVYPDTYLEGATVVGSACQIGPGAMIRDSKVGDRCQVVFSVLEQAILEEEVSVGPFAHLRPRAHLMRGVHMGNFGEVKNSTLGPGSKMGHFSYIGDTTVGEEANIGAGTITCNFDGEKKHATEIGAHAFIGSDTMLVAPVRVGERARTGAGAVVTRDVPDDTLAVGMPARAIKKLKKS
jgi:bifunctional UDP-N-acetylglucosamine pyrophosphorylase/glucosamine-1-phosphate N-acetyltransferase